MSSRLAMTVLESGLAPALKPAAVVMALFANDDGDRIYPSVERVAHLLGVTRRTAERLISHLRRVGVLVPEAAQEGGRLPGGRGRSVLYHLSVPALPSRDAYKPRHPRRGFRDKNPDTRDGVLSSKETPTPVTRTPTLVTRTPTPVTTNPDTGDANPDASVGRSLRGSLKEHKREHKREQDQTAADAPALAIAHEDPPRSTDVATPTDSDRSTAVEAENEDPPRPDGSATSTDPGASTVPFRVYVAIAKEAFHTSVRDDETDDSANVTEIFKRACAQHRPALPYTGELARKAVDAARVARNKKAAEFRAQLTAVAYHAGDVTRVGKVR